jgi:hypothetical protein
MGTRATRRVAAATASTAVAAMLLVSCTGDPEAEPAPTTPSASDAPRPSVTAEVVQLRRDQVLERVEVAVANTGDTDLVVETVRLDVEGFQLPGALRKDSPVQAGVVVNLPVPYSGIDCPQQGIPEVGEPEVTLRLHTAKDPTTRTVRMTAGDGDGLLQRIADRVCAVEQVQRQVDLRFDDGWRVDQTPDGPVAHGVLRARLLGGPARDITQVAGAILYGLRPDEGAATPLASLTPDRRDAQIPVAAFAARCDPHTIGEIKKPYEFLVWVTTPGGDEVAVTPEVGQVTQDALRRVCAF